jgi:hypothetical protein
MSAEENIVIVLTAGYLNRHTMFANGGVRVSTVNYGKI